MIEPDDSEKSILLNTIRLPKNFNSKKLENLGLPEKNYNPIKVKKVERYRTMMENDYGRSITELNSGRINTESNDNQR